MILWHAHAKCATVAEMPKTTKRTIQAALVLDTIRSAHNVGSIFRTADAIGVSHIYLCGTTPCPRDRFDRPRKDIAKVALGAEKTIAWTYCATTESALTMLKKEGFVLYALEQSESAIDYKKVAPKNTEKWALVLGNEVGGITQEVLQLCDTVIEIPMRGEKESLNVSVAAGIALARLSDL